MFKVILIGDPKVGKSSMLSQYVGGCFEDDYTPTISVDCDMKSLDLGKNHIILEI